MSLLNQEIQQSQFVDAAEWYKDAVIYQIHVKAYFDSNGDGIGDFKGLTEKLDYIRSLGVNTLWLLPFYPSPMRDDGYDIADYYDVAPDYGTIEDFENFINAAHERGLKVITELVINHTSDQHPWFKEARQSPRDSEARNIYVWSDDDSQYADTRIIFTDTESSNWSWDPVAKQYYWHRFFSHQPDLNHNNPHVVERVIDVMKFWLDKGVDGLRLDAIPYLCVREGTENENLPETHQVIKQIRAAVDENYENRMLLAEANQWPEDVREYFGDGDECHMAYHFPLMPRMYMAVAQEISHPIIEIMEQTPGIPDNCQWAIFLRNHDELTLEMVTDKERDYMYATYAMDPRMRVNVGIRRRLAPLMDNDQARIRLLNSLLLSMPGSPIIYYGDEIGMGDNIYLRDRNSVRTPMQWTPDRNGGFSRARPERLYSQPIMDSVYGYEAVNVEAQSDSPGSLLNWTRRMLAVRGNQAALGRGQIHFLRPGNKSVLAYLRSYEGQTILCVANLSRNAQPVELNLEQFSGHTPTELLGQTVFPPIGHLPYLITLPGYAFYWFSLQPETIQPSWHEDQTLPEDTPVMVMFQRWQTLFPEQIKGTRSTLAAQEARRFCHYLQTNYLPRQRWYTTNDEQNTLTLEDADYFYNDNLKEPMLLLARHPDPQHNGNILLGLVGVYERDEQHMKRAIGHTICRFRDRQNMGILADAFSEPGYIRTMLNRLQQNDALPTAKGGQIHFTGYGHIQDISLPEHDDFELLSQTSDEGVSIHAIAKQVMLKVYRQGHEGSHPELDIKRYLQRHRFPYMAELLGAIEYEDNDGKFSTLAIAHRYQENRGNLRDFLSSYLERYLEDNIGASSDEAEPEQEQDYSSLDIIINKLGECTAALHTTLIGEDSDPLFAAEPITRADLDAWQQQALDYLASAIKTVDDAAPEYYQTPEWQQISQLRALNGRLEHFLRSMLPGTPFGSRTRYHGNYTLDQLLMHEDGLVITGFVRRDSAAPRDIKRASPLSDLAQLMHDLDKVTMDVAYRTYNRFPNQSEAIETSANKWRQQLRHTLLESYLAHLSEWDTGKHIVGEQRSELLNLLSFFETTLAIQDITNAVSSNDTQLDLAIYLLMNKVHLNRTTTSEEHEDDQ